MKHLFLKVSYIFLIATFVSACSTTKEQTPIDEKKYYSNDTLDFFNRIEQTKSNSFNNSRQAPRRNDDLDDSERLEGIVIDRNPPPVSRRTIPVAPTQRVIIPKQVIPESSNESLIEIQQHLSYYCMESKNLRRFNYSQNQCEAFGQRTLEACKKSTGAINKKAVDCVVKKLKNG